MHGNFFADPYGQEFLSQLIRIMLGVLNYRPI